MPALTVEEWEAKWKAIEVRAHALRIRSPVTQAGGGHTDFAGLAPSPGSPLPPTTCTPAARFPTAGLDANR